MHFPPPPAPLLSSFEKRRRLLPSDRRSHPIPSQSGTPHRYSHWQFKANACLMCQLWWSQLLHRDRGTSGAAASSPMNCVNREIIFTCLVADVCMACGRSPLSRNETGLGDGHGTAQAAAGEEEPWTLQAEAVFHHKLPGE